jgi:hypothetical protein
MTDGGCSVLAVFPAWLVTITGSSLHTATLEPTNVVTATTSTPRPGAPSGRTAVSRRVTFTGLSGLGISPVTTRRQAPVTTIFRRSISLAVGASSGISSVATPHLRAVTSLAPSAKQVPPPRHQHVAIGSGGEKVLRHNRVDEASPAATRGLCRTLRRRREWKGKSKSCQLMGRIRAGKIQGR